MDAQEFQSKLESMVEDVLELSMDLDDVEVNSEEDYDALGWIENAFDNLERESHAQIKAVDQLMEDNDEYEC